MVVIKKQACVSGGDNDLVMVMVAMVANMMVCVVN